MQKNALTVDVEDYFHVAAFADVIGNDEWNQFTSRVERNVDHLLRIFSENNAKGTFFVLGWVADHFPGTVKAIAAEGHEIASHGYSHQLVYTQSKETFREETLRSKKLLEDLVQKPVVGYRAASYSITRESLWALDILAEAGFQYDSSIFPVRHDRYGLLGSPLEPYVVNTESGRSIVEVPLSVLPLAGVPVPVSGGGYFRIFPYRFTRWAFRRLNKRFNRSVVFYLHPWEVDPQQPRLQGKLLSRFRHYVNLSRCEPRLRALLRDFEFQPMSEMLQERTAETLTYRQNDLGSLAARA